MLSFEKRNPYLNELLVYMYTHIGGVFMPFTLS